MRRNDQKVTQNKAESRFDSVARFRRHTLHEWERLVREMLVAGTHPKPILHTPIDPHPRQIMDYYDAMPVFTGFSCVYGNMLNKNLTHLRGSSWGFYLLRRDPSHLDTIAKKSISQ